MTGCSVEDATKEVDATIQRLFYWGAYADKYGGNVQVSLRTHLLWGYIYARNFYMVNILEHVFTGH